ncbi:Ribulose-5-phosphate 4-epimerase/Fuculose-1-phosphate aldolase [Tistlia consotensis]|uniref:Ribulose-5-phosphate 4-epimerase/Fuculose-1-phosphate aldolase n=1 Tax=Tistlia consotensis USBA 355 TaxID=560819 RepID=A0A1Y6BHM4_9PROT|nr:class II aldolase/adducin family protein [Tistlia consotensis]SMF12193.1 Ribulose-5-phosphate 4-epimerase/Fuculose-1-phosphate aldolase [Tistlia consotensis USBA 355]SNR51303.1 Ribulose-5-phosphate 4-epimerase/Fuculose-1-phosphate aldolase [Tistlia consotensis]
MTDLAEARPARWSAEEWQRRVELAACYRLVARYGMTDLVYTHISARVPGTRDQFLINGYGLLFEEITASSLVKIDLDGRPVEDSDWEVNPAGFTIHSAIHQQRHDAECVVHTHTVAGMAVAAQQEGLLPINQMSMQFHGRLAYHDYEGIALDLDERGRLQRDLGDKPCMILRNHGLLTVGVTVGEAFSLMYYLNKACELQVAALAGGRPLVIPSDNVCAHAAGQFDVGTPTAGQLEWTALLRRLDREEPDYKT